MTVTFCAAGVRAAANITRAAKRACGEATEAIVYGGGLPQKIFKWPRRMHGEVRGEAAHSLPEISNCVCVCVCIICLVRVSLPEISNYVCVCVCVCIICLVRV